jgi:hypothetical protein
MGLKEAESDIRSIKETLVWHWKIGAAIAAFFGIVFTGLLTWYLPKEFDNQRKQISIEIKSTIGDVLVHTSGKSTKGNEIEEVGRKLPRWK